MGTVDLTICLYLCKQMSPRQIDGRRGLLQLWWQMHPTAKPCGNPVELFGVVFGMIPVLDFLKNIGTSLVEVYRRGLARLKLGEPRAALEDFCSI